MSDPSVFSFIISFVLHIDQHLFALVQQYGAWLYVILFFVVFCETGLVVTPFLPGASLLFAAGALSGAGLLSYTLAMAVLLAAAVIGDAVNYEIGRLTGPSIFHRNNRWLNKRHLLKAHAFYRLHGGKAIILARFVPVVRTFAPFVAGVALMHPVRFLSFNISGAVLWVALLVSAGHFFGNIPLFKTHFSLMVYGIIAVSLLPILYGVVRSRLRRRARRCR